MAVKQGPPGGVMTKRKAPFLAYCEYVSPDTRDSIQASRARLRLFETVRSTCPKMLKELSDKVFPLFEELAGASHIFWGINGPPHVSPHELLTQTSVASSGGHTADTPASTKKRQELKLAFDAWANAFHLTERWAKDETVRTLGHWHRDPEGRKSLKWNPFYAHSSRASIGKPFEFCCEGWETELLTWSRYRESVCRRFKEKLREYEKATRQQAESCGLVRSQRKYSLVNFEWFVRYQFAGWSSTKIAEECWLGQSRGPDESTVLKGVKAAAELIGWTELRKNYGRKIR